MTFVELAKVLSQQKITSLKETDVSIPDNFICMKNQLKIKG